MESNEAQNIEEDTNTQVKYSTQKTNTIMGLAAIFISVLSMFAVIYQSYLAREENELMRIQQSATVLPYLDYWYSNIGMEYKFVIENKGVGPAFIKDVKFIGIDSKMDSLFFKDSNGLHDFMSQESSFLDSISIVRSPIQANMLLSPNEKRAIFAFSFDNNNQKKRFSDEFYKYYGGYRITYEDVYGTAWILHSNKDFPQKLSEEH